VLLRRFDRAFPRPRRVRFADPSSPNRARAASFAIRRTPRVRASGFPLLRCRVCSWSFRLMILRRKTISRSLRPAGLSQGDQRRETMPPQKKGRRRRAPSSERSSVCAHEAIALVIASAAVTTPFRATGCIHRRVPLGRMAVVPFARYTSADRTFVRPTDDQSPARGLCAPVARRAASRGARRLGRRAR